ncbi:MAG: ATP-binding SpoIIE family protein phosphatase [Massilia sp.]
MPDVFNSSLQSQQWIGVAHASDIATARRAGQQIAQRQGFDGTRAGQLAILITEAATNLLKHAGDGRILVSAVSEGESRGVELLVLDKGPGIANLAHALRDGVSSAGTAGNGLGAMQRLADSFDVYAPRGGGAALTMRLWAEGAQATGPAARIGAACLPLAGEDFSGDGWAVASDERHTTLLLVDGLGHGPEAARVARAAIECLERDPALAPAAQIEAMHKALAPTRGAALAVAQYRAGDSQLQFAGVGNIGACLIDGESRRQLMSHNGIVGHNMRKVQQLAYPGAPGALLVMHSDGVNTQWDLGQHPGLAAGAPSLVAGVLLRDHARLRDDACVLAHRLAAGTR